MGKRIGTSLLGIPVWIITATALFVIYSAIYDWVVMDRSNIRTYLLLGSGGVIFLITFVLHLMPLSAVAKQARRQLGS